MQNCIEEFRDRFTELGIEIDLPPVVQALSEEELSAMIDGYDGIIAGDDPLTAKVLDKARRLRIISKWGVGTDGIDLDAAQTRRIVVTNTPGVFGDAVADVAAAYMVMLARQLHRIDASVRAGGWWKHEGTELRGKTLGVVGFGTIGRAVAQRGHGFGMSVIAHDSADVSMAAADADVELVDRDAVFRRADFLVLCCPLTTATRHLVNAETLAQMKLGS
ncbi:MAG: NAD(P)-dependent oxidoreductase, partial [Gaiellaceae bacterium]